MSNLQKLMLAAFLCTFLIQNASASNEERYNPLKLKYLRKFVTKCGKPIFGNDYEAFDKSKALYNKVRNSETLQTLIQKVKAYRPGDLVVKPLWNSVHARNLREAANDLKEEMREHARQTKQEFDEFMVDYYFGKITRTAMETDTAQNAFETLRDVKNQMKEQGKNGYEYAKQALASVKEAYDNYESVLIKPLIKSDAFQTLKKKVQNYKFGDGYRYVNNKVENSEKAQNLKQMMSDLKEEMKQLSKETKEDFEEWWAHYEFGDLTNSAIESDTVQNTLTIVVMVKDEMKQRTQDGYEYAKEALHRLKELYDFGDIEFADCDESEINEDLSYPNTRKQ